MTTLFQLESTTESSAFQSAADLEPDEQWRRRLTVDIENNLRSKVDESKQNLHDALKGGSVTAVEREQLTEEHLATMKKICNLAEEQFRIALERERQERRRTAGQPLDQEPSDSVIKEQQAVLDNIEGERKDNAAQPFSSSSQPITVPSYKLPSMLEVKPSPTELDKVPRSARPADAQDSIRRESPRPKANISTRQLPEIWLPSITPEQDAKMSRAFIMERPSHGSTAGTTSSYPVPLVLNTPVSSEPRDVLMLTMKSERDRISALEQERYPEIWLPSVTPEQDAKMSRAFIMGRQGSTAGTTYPYRVPSVLNTPVSSEPRGVLMITMGSETDRISAVEQEWSAMDRGSAKRKEEEVRLKEEAARAKEEEIRRKEAGLAQREEELLRREAEAVQQQESRKREEEIRHQHAEAQAKKRAEDLRRQEEDRHKEEAKLKEEVARAKEEIQRKEEELTRRGETLAQREEALAQREEVLAQREEEHGSPEDLTNELQGRSPYPITSGGFGDIWKCDLVKPSETIQVAVKTIRAFESDNEELVRKNAKRVRRELKVWGRLKHHSILPLWGVANDFGLHPAMVCPWADNGALTGFLERQQDKLSSQDKFSLLNDIALGLQYLHSKSVVHGDLTGSNVLIYGNGRACLADFGLSTIVLEFVGTSYFTSTIRGNIRWVAAELFDAPEGNEASLSTECDIYSFGSIILQVLTCKVPYYNVKKDLAVLGQVIKGKKPEPPQKSHIAPGHWEFIQRCWSPRASRPLVGEIVAFVGCEQQALSP